MKLRLRCLETQATSRVELPDHSSFQQLQQSLSGLSAHFSLNRKDELYASSPEVSLQTLGVTSGDLIYYSTDPHAFSSPHRELRSNNISPVQETLVMNGSHRNQTSESSSAHGNVASGNNYAASNEIPDRDFSVLGKACESDTADSTNLKYEAVSVEDTELMDMDDEPRKVCDDETIKMCEDEPKLDENEAEAETEVEKLTVPYFLKRVLRGELSENDGDRKLLVVAVHAVLLESGFVGFNPESSTRVDRLSFTDDWSSMSLWYTLPDLFGNKSSVIDYVVLKFQNLGHFVNVYGSVAKVGSALSRVCLDAYEFAPILDFMWSKSVEKAKLSDEDDTFHSIIEKEIFEFWKMVKDGIALPLMIDLCDKSGLSLPPCLMRLPTDLKSKILYSMSGVDIAKVACTCTEMRYLASSNDLWKVKFKEEFGRSQVYGALHWQGLFAKNWKEKKKHQFCVLYWPDSGTVDGPYFYRHPREMVNPYDIPQPIGGDYDRFPWVLPQPGRMFPRSRRLQNFQPNCNLRGRRYH